VNHLCFSPQFYFVETYYSWGIILLMLSFTTLLRHSMNPFSDPVFVFFISQQLLCNRILDWMIRKMTMMMWRPKDNAAARAFSNSISRGLKQKEAEIRAHEFRTWFFEKHRGWLIDELGRIFTPRSLKRYRPALVDLYQNILKLQPPYQYKVPMPSEDARFPPVLEKEYEQDSDEEEAAMRQQLGLTDAPAAGTADAGGPRLGALGDAPLPPPPGLKTLPPPPGGKAAPVAMVPDKPGETPWPLKPRDPNVVQHPQDVPPLAALVGRAWWKTAKRHVEMLRLAEQWRREERRRDTCETCGVCENDTNAFAPDGMWTAAGPQLRLQESVDIHTLMTEFEKHHGVPPLAFDPDQWRIWLSKHQLWATLCWRCVQVMGLRPVTPPASEVDKAELLDVPRPVRSDMSDTSSEADDPAAAAFPEWVDVQVSATSREMMMIWARKARESMKAKKKAAAQGPPESPAALPPPPPQGTLRLAQSREGRARGTGPPPV